MINELNFKAVSYLNMREEQSEERQRGGVHDVDEGVLGQHAGPVRVVRRGPGRRRVQVEVGAAEVMRVVTVTPACINKRILLVVTAVTKFSALFELLTI